MCPVCATSAATWLLAGTLGSGGAVAVAKKMEWTGRRVAGACCRTNGCPFVNLLPASTVRKQLSRREFKCFLKWAHSHPATTGRILAAQSQINGS